MAEHGVAALSHVPSGERVRTGPADPSGAWDQDHPPSTETTTQESGLRENRTSRLSERTEEGRKPDLLRLYNQPRARSSPRPSRRPRRGASGGARPARRSVSWLVLPPVACSAGAKVTNATISIAGQSGIVLAVVITAARLQPVLVCGVFMVPSLTAGQTA